MSNPTKLSKKELNWVSRAVLSTDNDDVGLFRKIHTKTYEKRRLFCKKISDFIQL